MNIYLSKPINKTAALVTSQSGCAENFMNSAKEELKLLGEKKLRLMDYICSLKKEIGIDGRENNGARTKYPRKILNHPMFKSYLAAKEKAAELDKEILIIRKEIPQKGKNINDIILNIVKSEYPDIFTYALEKAKEIK